MASLSNDLEGLNLNLPDVVAEAAGLEPTTSVPSTPKKSVRNRRGRRGGANKKSTGSEVQIPAGTSAVKLEDLGACALVNDDQRVPNISLHNLEDFLEVSTDDEKTVEDLKNVEAVVVEDSESLPKVTETSKKGRSRHAVDNFYHFS